MSKHSYGDAEIQTTVDECADGTWQATLYVGSNFVGRYDGATFREACDRMARELDEELASRGTAPRWMAGNERSG